MFECSCRYCISGPEGHIPSVHRNTVRLEAARKRELDTDDKGRKVN